MELSYFTQKELAYLLFGLYFVPKDQRKKGIVFSKFWGKQKERLKINQTIQLVQK